MANKKNVEAIYNQFKDPLYNYLYRMCGDHALAQDIVQHTFVKVLTDPKIVEVEHLKAYLYTIARNRLLDEWKRKPTESLDTEFMPDTSDDDNQPHDQLEQAEINDEILKVLQRMPVNFREVMLLRYSEDMAVADVAKITGRSVSDIKVSLHRARHKFESQFTTNMYSKVALSRSQCDKLKGMLAPYRDGDLSDTQIDMINKHISQCAVCSEDTEEMKRKRQLFAALPILPFPLGFDEFAKHLPGSASNSNSDSTDTSNVSDGGTGHAMAHTVSGKLVAGVAAGVIAGSIGLYFAANDDGAVSTAPTNKTVSTSNPTAPPTPPPPKPKKDQGQLSVQAQFGKQATAPAFANAIEWTLQENSPANGVAPNVQHAKGSTAAFTLNKGQYTVIARLGTYEERTTVEIEGGDKQNQTIELNLGQLQVGPLTPTDKDVTATDIEWSVHRKDAENTRIALFKGNKDLLLSSGEYQLVARYPNNLISRRDLQIRAGDNLQIDSVALDHGRLQLAGQLSSPTSDKLAGLTWLVDRLQDGKTQESRLAEASGPTSEFMLAPGDYRIRVLYGVNAETNLNASIEKGKTTSRRDVVIQSGTITLDAQWPPALKGQPPAVHWEIHNAVPSLSEKTRIAQAALTPASFTLAPGKYRLRALTGLNFMTEQAFEVHAASNIQPVPVTIAPAAIQLSAFGSHSNQPLNSNLHWSLESANANALKDAPPLAEADTAKPRFVLQAGRYRVTVRHQNKFVQSAEYDLQPGTSLDEAITINDDPNPKKFIWR